MNHNPADGFFLHPTIKFGPAHFFFCGIVAGVIHRQQHHYHYGVEPVDIKGKSTALPFIVFA